MSDKTPLSRMIKPSSASVDNELTVEDVDWKFLDFEELKSVILTAFKNQLQHAATYDVHVSLFDGKLNIGLPLGSENEPIVWSADFLEIVTMEANLPLDQGGLFGLRDLLRKAIDIVEAKIADE